MDIEKGDRLVSFFAFEGTIEAWCRKAGRNPKISAPTDVPPFIDFVPPGCYYVIVLAAALVALYLDR